LLPGKKAGDLIARYLSGDATPCKQLVGTPSKWVRKQIEGGRGDRNVYLKPLGGLIFFVEWDEEQE